MKNRILFGGLLVLLLSISACSKDEAAPAASAAPEPAPAPVVSAEPESESFTVLVGGTDIGQLEVVHSADSARVEYEYSNNGRGPSIRESITFGESDLPQKWSIEGHTTFGNEVDERFTLVNGEASWKDATGTGTASPAGSSLYVAQDASPYALWIYARALLADEDHEMPVLPGGTLRLERIEDIPVQGPSGELSLTSYELSGIDLNPTYFLLDQNERFFAVVSPRFAVVREGFEAEDQRIRALAEEYAAKRFETIQAKVAKNFETPVRVSNVYVFDPNTQSRSGPVSVQVKGERISALLPIDAPLESGEVLIDGGGGTLLPACTKCMATWGRTVRC